MIEESKGDCLWSEKFVKLCYCKTNKGGGAFYEFLGGFNRQK
jgi:hypothetical protein